MRTEATWANPQTLRRLREESGLTIAVVAEQSQKLKKAHFVPVTVEQLQQWEAGRDTPELEHLETLSELYQCPLGYFFRPAPPEEERRLSFRGLAPRKEESFSATTRASLRRFVELAEWFVTMLEEHGMDWEVQIPQAAEEPPDPNSLAQRERSRLGFSESVRQQWESAGDAFGWWRQRIEGQGVFCFELKLEPKDVRGASLWIKRRYPFILVNRQDAEAATGRLFTLLHEYGHLLLGRGREGIACDFRGRERGRGTEPLVNNFAASVLLPAQELRRHLAQEDQAQYRDEWSDTELRRLATRFFVSRDVVAITLEQLQLAPAGFYRQKREQWEQSYAKWQPWGRGRNPTKWERKARELGGSALRVLLRLQRQESLPVLDAAYLLDTKVEKLNQFMEGFRTVVQGE